MRDEAHRTELLLIPHPSSLEKVMQALVYPAYGELEVREVPEPIPGPGEVLVRVGACGICGSELGNFAARSPRRVPPLVMGHEFAGTGVAAGEGTVDAREADRVVVKAALRKGAERVAVSEPNPERRAVARALGAAAAWDPREGGLTAAVMAFTDGAGADLVIDAVGSAETKRDSVAAARRGGELVWIGLHGDEVTLSSFALILG